MKKLKTIRENWDNTTQSADKKPEKYIKPDGKVGIRMVPVKKEEATNNQIDELTAAEKKLVNQMYDKKGNLTPLGKKVMNHGKKKGDKGFVESLDDRFMDENTEIVEAQDPEMEKVKQLVRIGLMNKKDMTKIVRALTLMKEGKPVPQKERKILFDMLGELIGMITGDNAMFNKARKVVKEQKDMPRRPIKHADMDPYDHIDHADHHDDHAKKHHDLSNDARRANDAHEAIAHEKARDAHKAAAKLHRKAYDNHTPVNSGKAFGQSKTAHVQSNTASSMRESLDEATYSDTGWQKPKKDTMSKFSGMQKARALAKKGQSLAKDDTSDKPTRIKLRGFGPDHKRTSGSSLKKIGMQSNEEVNVEEALERDGPKKPDIFGPKGSFGKSASTSPAIQKYMAKKAKNNQDRNKATDPGAAKKGYGIGVTDTDKADKKAKGKGTSIMKRMASRGKNYKAGKMM